MKRLFLDLETAPLICLSWKTGWKINLSHENIISERKIIVAAWKWEGEKKVHALWWDKNQDDKKLLETLIPIMNEADEIVGHWLENFDLPWVRTRALVHRIPTKPMYKTVDTCKWARSYFLFNSNKLDYIAKLLGLGRKIRTEDGLWRKVVLHKCEKSLRFMVKYCKQDIHLLKSVWARMQQVVPHKTHAGVLAGLEKWTCPKDGSRNVKTSKKYVTARGTVQWQFKCNDCGAYYTLSDQVKEKYAEERRIPSS